MWSGKEKKCSFLLKWSAINHSQTQTYFPQKGKKNRVSILHSMVYGGGRTFQPRTFQPQASTPDLKTPDFSAVNIPTPDFSTMNFPSPDFSTPVWGWKFRGWNLLREHFNPGLFNPKHQSKTLRKHFNTRFFNPRLGVGKSWVERSGVEAWDWKVRGWNVL